jgi:L-fuculose-phosphate aldolase
MSDSEHTARADLASAYRTLGELRLNELASGNASVRFGEGMLISPTGASAETIDAASVVYVGPNGDWAPGQRPSSEWRLHAAVYRQIPQTNAVVHTHSDYCVAVSCHGRPLPGFHYLVGFLGGDDVPCVPYSTFGGETLARDVAAALTTRTACLMSNHGMTARGATLRSAISTARRLEILCRQYVLARALGEPSRLAAAEWEGFFEQVRATGYSET